MSGGFQGRDGNDRVTDFGRFRPVRFAARNRTGGYGADRTRIGLPNGDQGG